MNKYLKTHTDEDLLASLMPLNGSRVKAKRDGWDEPPEGVPIYLDEDPSVLLDYTDPPAWRDHGLPEDIEGELEISQTDPHELYPNGLILYHVDGQPVDPRTIKPL
jgi:hypothetical protein